MAALGIKIEPLINQTEDIGLDFTPYQKIANKIDDCLSTLGFLKVMGRVKDAIQKENELQELQAEIIRIKAKQRLRNQIL